MEQISKRLMNWASILEDATRAAGGATSRDAVHLPAPRADARRPPRQGRDRRVGHPDARRDHPGRGRGGHRLRHDRGPDAVHRGRAAAATWPALRAAIERGGPAVGRQRTTDRRRLEHTAEPDRRAGGRPRRGFDPAQVRRRTGGCSSAPSARATTSSRSASTRTDRVWLFLHSGSRGVGNKIAPAPHQGRAAAVRAVVDPAARPGPGLPGGGHAGVLGLHRASCGGRSSSRCSTARR